MRNEPRPTRYPCVIATRVDNETAAALKDRAASLGINLGDIARDLLIQAAGVSDAAPIKQRRVPDGAALAEMLGTLGRIGGNLQRCYVAAASKNLAFDAGEFALVRDEVRAAMAELRDLIGGPR